MESLTLALPYAPSDNERYIGRTKTLSPIVNAYRRAVETTKLEKRVPRISDNVKVQVSLFPANERRDSMNCMKVLLDTLETVGVLKNDRQVKEVEIFRGKVHPSDIMIVRFLPWLGFIPDDPQEIAERAGTFVSANDLASIRAKVPMLDKKVFRRK